MKNTSLILLMSICLVCAANAQAITVESDRALDADFSKYKTFFWSTQVDQELDEGLYFLNDLVLKGQIRDAVKAEMLGLGYKLEPDNPDLIVNFRVFDQPVTLHGFEGYGTDFWGGQQYRQISDTASYKLDAGTLLLSLADRESGAVVWQGFASGLIKNDTFIKDQGKIYEAVNLIFEEFNQRAKEYSRK
jgi:hypothetical protein